jgi:hypothetical protein
MSISPIGAALIITLSFCCQPPEPVSGTGDAAAIAAIRSFAGEYYAGDGYGFRYLDVAPSGRFSFELFWDDGGGSRKEGTVGVVDGRLFLHPAKRVSEKAIADGDFSRLLPVRYGKRLYLLQDSELLGFCNAINLGLEPRNTMDGRYYLRMKMTKLVRTGKAEPELAAADGQPELPRGWASFLLAGTLNDEIRDVLDVNRARVSLGTKQRVLRGMRLFVEGRGPSEPLSVRRPYAVASVREVGEDSCVIEVEHPEFFRRFEKGQKVSSRIPASVIKKEGRSFFW